MVGRGRASGKPAGYLVVTGVDEQPEDAFVTLKVYNLLGQEVASLRDEMQSSGFHDVVWNGRNNPGQTVSSGVYFYRLEAKPLDGAEPFTSLKKMLMLK